MCNYYYRYIFYRNKLLLLVCYFVFYCIFLISIFCTWILCTSKKVELILITDDLRMINLRTGTKSTPGTRTPRLTVYRNFFSPSQNIGFENFKLRQEFFLQISGIRSPMSHSGPATCIKRYSVPATKLHRSVALF